MSIGIGNRIGASSSFWKSYQNFLAEGRSGLTIPAKKGVSPTILLPVWDNSQHNGYSSIVDDGALDVGNDYDFTLVHKCKSNLASKVNVRFLVGKNIGASVNGRYGFSTSATTCYLSAIIQSSGGTVTIASTIDYTAQEYVFLRMDVNQATKKFRFFVNEIQIGTDTSFTGTFNTLAEAYKFYIGAGTKSDLSTYLFSNSFHGDTWIFRKLLSVEEGATLMAGGVVSGELAHWTCGNAASGYHFDSSGNNYHLAITTNSYEKYSIEGSRYCLDHGYTLYGNTYGTLNRYLPLTLAGNEITPPDLGAGVEKIKNYAGMLDYHNFANSMIQFSDDFWDRSNVTIWNDFARAVTTYYNSTDINTKKQFHPRELGNLHLSKWLNDDYRGVPFFTMGANTWDAREKLESIFTLSKNTTGVVYNQILTYCKDLPFPSGTFYAMGIGTNYYTSTDPRLLISKLKEGPFIEFKNITCTERTATHFGNAKVLQISSNKWLMIFEVKEGDQYNQVLATSVNGINWVQTMVLPLPTGVTVYGQGGYFVDNDDPTDFNNIHYTGFSLNPGIVWETHPLNANFTEWSDPVAIFNTGYTKIFNQTILLISGVYHMYYSRFDTEANTHYMHHATCTTNPFGTVNDWANIDVGDWSGLGSIESFSFINLGGANWVMYYYDIFNFIYRYTLSEDNCATFDAGVIIYSLSYPLSYATSVIKLK
jgi:hypothetical protein